MSFTQTVKELYWATRLHAGILASIYGEHLGIDALTYNRVVMERFAITAKASGDALADAACKVWPDMRSMTDLGCGTGHYVKGFAVRGIAAVGYERSRHARRFARELHVTIHPLDLTRPPDIPRSDLAISLEVIEHLPPDLGERLIDLMARTAPRIVFSGAQPGQGGDGHVNEQPLTHWQAQWSQRGYRYLEDATEQVRQRLSEQKGVPRWLIRNVMLFEAH